jgi:hypothetical protein
MFAIGAYNSELATRVGPGIRLWSHAPVHTTVSISDKWLVGHLIPAIGHACPPSSRSLAA